MTPVAVVVVVLEVVDLSVAAGFLAAGAFAGAEVVDEDCAVGLLPGAGASCVNAVPSSSMPASEWYKMVSGILIFCYCPIAPERWATSALWKVCLLSWG